MYIDANSLHRMTVVLEAVIVFTSKLSEIGGFKDDEDVDVTNHIAEFLDTLTTIYSSPESAAIDLLMAKLALESVEPPSEAN